MGEVDKTGKKRLEGLVGQPSTFVKGYTTEIWEDTGKFGLLRDSTEETRGEFGRGAATEVNCAEKSLGDEDLAHNISVHVVLDMFLKKQLLEIWQ